MAALSKRDQLLSFTRPGHRAGFLLPPNPLSTSLGADGYLGLEGRSRAAPAAGRFDPDAGNKHVHSTMQIQRWLYR